MSKGKKQLKDSEALHGATDGASSTKEKESNTKPKEASISTLQLFRYATIKERLMILVAIIFSAGTGALQPISILVYGSFIENISSSISDTSNLLEVTLPVIRTMVYMGTAAFIAAYASTCFWILTGESQTRRIRSLYLKSVLNQDMRWFDGATKGSLNTRLASDTQLIQDGISEKFGLFVSFFAQFVGGFVVAFIKGTYIYLLTNRNLLITILIPNTKKL
jgi:ATP-binding cassette subfamily B (MDR/TAP) protein 1